MRTNMNVSCDMTLPTRLHHINAELLVSRAQWNQPPGASHSLSQSHQTFSSSSRHGRWLAEAISCRVFGSPHA
jgi:hypothetical protein